MTWAFKRQVFYIVVLILFFSIFGFLIVFPQFNKAPSCADGVQNGDETGIDCGGSCPNACLAQVDPISILWARAFRVVPGRYNAVAYLENHNKNAVVSNISYRFRFADVNNIYIGKREGTTLIPPAGKFAVFEPAIDVGNSIPVYTTFEFTQTPEWLTISQDKINQFQVLISNVSLLEEATSPRLSATIRNSSPYTIPAMNIVAILYDNLGNAISASHTYLGTLSGEESGDINFTWPEPFSAKVFVKEIIPMYNFWSK